MDVGFPSFTHETDARKDPNPQRPYIELWAGVSDPFFHSASLPALGEVSVPETCSPAVGMSNVTHANENILVNLAAEDARVNLQFFSVGPAAPLRVTLKRGDAVLFDDAVLANPENGNRVDAAIPPGGSAGQVQLTIATADGKADRSRDRNKTSRPAKSEKVSGYRLDILYMGLFCNFCKRTGPRRVRVTRWSSPAAENSRSAAAGRGRRRRRRPDRHARPDDG